MKKIILLFAVFLMLGSCKKDKTQKTSVGDDKTKVGFITVGPKNDFGYNYSHNLGKDYIDQNAGSEFETQLFEKIPENAEVERVMERMIANGTKIIFPTSYGYLESALRVAEKHPDVVFMHCGGYKNSKNLGTYFAYIHEPMYLSGIAAGRMTKTNKLGFVASFPIPQVVRNINAFTLGARSVNKDVVINVVWTSNWYDPATEAEAAKSLINKGADVLTMHQDSPKTVVETAEKEGVMSVGYHVDVNQLAPKGWITGARWNWGDLYLDLAKQAKSNSWKTSQIREGMDKGHVDISSFGAIVGEEVRNEVLAVRNKIVNEGYQLFQAPLLDNEGNVQLKEGDPVTFEWMESMDYFVEGVAGQVPKSK